jgi:hypothetical protein
MRQGSASGFQYAQARREVKAISAAILKAIEDVDSPQGRDRSSGPVSGGDVSDPTLAAALSRNEVREGALKWLRDLTRLANDAKRIWPAQPKAGDVIDGVKVLEKASTAVICVECGAPIGANAADPLARIDGRPFHRRPCYDTVSQRRRRVSRRDSVSS